MLSARSSRRAPIRQARFNSWRRPGGEGGVAGLDRILRVADQMGEADLMGALRPAHLGGEAVGRRSQNGGEKHWFIGRDGWWDIPRHHPLKGTLRGIPP